MSLRDQNKTEQILRKTKVTDIARRMANISGSRLDTLNVERMVDGVEDFLSAPLTLEDARAGCGKVGGIRWIRAAQNRSL